MSKQNLKSYLKNIVEFYGSSKESIVVYDVDILKNTIVKFRKVLSKFNDIKLLYAVKANNNKDILMLMNKYVDGVDVASMEELELCKNIFTQDVISINGADFSYSQLARLIDEGYNVDLNTIDQVKNIVTEKNYGVRLTLVGENLQRESRFGINIFDEDSAKIILSKTNLIHRIHIHDGDKNDLFIDRFEKVIMKIIELGISQNIKEINIGGGFKNLVEMNMLEDFLRKIYRIINKYNMINVQVFIEPGYSLVSNCGFLCSRVSSCFLEGSKQIVTVNTSAFRNFLWFLPIPINLVFDSSSGIKTCIYGDTCFEHDVFCNGESLPLLYTGDVIIFYPVGAYSRSNHTNLHNKKYPKEVIMGDKNGI